jgi:hypothetical protein
MSSRGTLALFLLFIAIHLFPQDWERFAASSDRSADTLILQIMAAGDLETNITLCKGLARRSDNNISAILEFLVNGHSGKTFTSTELLLRYLLEGVRDAYSSEMLLRTWVATNEVSMETLLLKITDWKSPQLRGVLLSYASVVPEQQGIRAIIDVGASLDLELNATQGWIPYPEKALVLNFLQAASRARNPDLLSYCAEIARLSRDKVLVDAARSAATAIASAS